jgi:hypothetical protein
MQTLTDLEAQILAFERQRWNHAGAKASAIRDLFDLSETAYYQRLNLLIDQPAALVSDPQLVNRLRRLRDQRRRARISSRTPR